MTWVDLFNAFKGSIEIPQNGNYPITVNAVYKWQNGEEIEVLSDSHTMCIDLGGEYSNRYTVKIRIDYNNCVTAAIDIKGVNSFSFPVTKQDDGFDKRIAITPLLTDYDIIKELHSIYNWIFKVYNSIN